ncbi:helix-turn-helix domain-containing protein [Streptomyces uncialis]|uniref:helix-turn-helix domain-containing protein n=1 Tax=Streptomyces uncialis TaxID=1048205 RepID=UPI00386C557A|nr:helix-turn-helix domain-containing protein [Streptomyces uncialis]
MTEAADQHIGTRVRIARTASGLTQVEMAGLLGRSEHWVQDIERGRLALDRYSVISSIADLTDVDVVWLLGQPYRLRGDGGSLAHAHIPALRTALRRAGLVLSGHPGLTPQGTPLATRDLHARAAAANRARQAADLPAVAVELPLLIEDLTTAIMTECGRPRGEALRLMADAARTARMCLNQLGYPDLAWVAAEVAAGAATVLDDPLVRAAVAWDRCGALLHQGSLPEAVAVAEAALRDLEPLAAARTPEPQALSMRGALHLRAAVAFARGAGTSGDAWARINEALTDADRLGPDWHDVDQQTVFGRGTVAVHAAEVGVEVEEPDTGLTKVPDADITSVPSKERRTHYEIDRARAFERMGRLSAAVATLKGAASSAPYYVYADPMSRALVSTLALKGVPSQASALSSLVRGMELAR